MGKYKTAVVALELNSDSDQRLLDITKELIEGGTSVYLVHAVEHMSSYGAAYGVSAGVDVEEVLLEEAKKNMLAITESLSLPADKGIVKIGPAKFLILEEAATVTADVIVVGSHGRHGVRLLLGSTANAILHGAKCDVLAIRLRG